ncbi:MAG: glycosyltransferase family 4 protein [Planctomycetes bacterium]|nr:glycosyltransferase family 4 protein [Planctomycetota bacterium]
MSKKKLCFPSTRNDPPMRVMLIAPHPCFEPRGTPMRVQLMCLMMCEMGIEVHLVTYPMGKTIQMPGLHYHRIPQLPFFRRVSIGFSMAKVVYDVFLVAKVLGLLVRWRFAALHAVEEAAVFAAPLGRLFRTPMIVDFNSEWVDQLSCHSSGAVRALAVIAAPLQRWTIRLSTCALTVCLALTEHVKRISPGKAVFQIEDVPLPNTDLPPNEDRMAALRRELQVEGRRVILYTGNLQPYQGVDLLVDALPGVADRHPDAVTVVVGGEPEEIARFRARSESIGVADCTRWVGQRDPETMPEFLDLAEVLVSPRREGENTPLKIYTYMASGRPTVATDLPTHTQVLDGELAILVEATPAGLADGLIRALDDPAAGSRMGARAKEAARRNHSCESFRTKMGELYAFVTS